MEKNTAEGVRYFYYSWEISVLVVEWP